MNMLTSDLTEFVMKPTLLVMVMLAVHFGLRRASAATRHLSLVLTLAGLLVLPFLTLGLPTWDLKVLPQATIAAPTAGVSYSATEPDTESMFAGYVPALGENTDDADASGGSSTIAGGGWGSLSNWLLPLWLLGSALLLARLVAGLLRMRWIVRRADPLDTPSVLELLEECRTALGLRTRPRLVCSERVGVPIVRGWRRPSLVVPLAFLGWSADRKRAVLLHELAHLKRVDWPLLMLGRVVAALYWFHPLVWYMERSAKRECEKACDDLVVANGTRPSDYAAHLLSIARACPSAPAGAMAALAVVRRSHLNSRLRSILNPLLSRSAPSRRCVTVVSTALLLVLVPLASVQFAERAYADEPTEPLRETRDAPEFLLTQHEKTEHYDRHDAQDDTDCNHRVECDEGDCHDVTACAENESSEGGRSFKKGYSLHQKGHYEEAREAFEKAIALDHRPDVAMYNVACGYALQGRTGASLRWLEQAQAEGMSEPRMLVRDSDFDPIRADADFQRFVDRAFEAAGIERDGEKDFPYRTALENLEHLEQTESTSTKAWYHAGSEMLAYREYDRAIRALTSAVEVSGVPNANAMYNLACAYSLDGNSRRALEWLDRAVAAGFSQHERFLNDSDLDSLRGTREFENIAETSELLALDRFPRRGWEQSNYSEDRWAPAITLYTDFVGDHPNSGRGWFNLGYALHYSHRFDEAFPPFERALKLGFQPGITAYNLACGNAMMNRNDAAMKWLEQAVDAGVGVGTLEHDEDLENLRDDARFQALIERLEDKRDQEKAARVKKKKAEHSMQKKRTIRRANETI